MRYSAGELDNLESALNRSISVMQYFAVFLREQRGDFLAISLDQFLEAEHDAGTPQYRRSRPTRKCLLRRLNCRIDVCFVSHYDFGALFASCRIKDLAVTIRAGFVHLPVDPVRNFPDYIQCCRFFGHAGLPV